MSLSGIRTLPHQIEAVYQAMLPQPRLRFLLADDPGAGKTIMAGLLAKELKLREAIERILILCPAPLTIQWQDEMLHWFGEPFDMIFSAVDQQQLTNPWQRSSQIIASIDYAKQEDVRERVWQQRWDLIIIDEAHKRSARTASGGQNREPKVATTRRYDLASRLTSQADHVLLLTATPHHGDEDKFAHLLRLIDPDLFPEPHRLGRQATSIRRIVGRVAEHVGKVDVFQRENLADHIENAAYGQNVELDGQDGLSARSRPRAKRRRASTECAISPNGATTKSSGGPVTTARPPAPLIDTLHRILWLVENQHRNLNQFLDEAWPDRERLRLVAQALAGTALAGRKGDGPERTLATTPAEQAALKKLVANRRALIDQRLAPGEGTPFAMQRR